MSACFLLLAIDDDDDGLITPARTHTLDLLLMLPLAAQSHVSARPGALIAAAAC